MDKLKVEACKVKHIFNEDNLKRLNRFLGTGIGEHEPVFCGVTPVYSFLVKMLKEESLPKYKKESLTEALNKIEKFAEERNWSKWLN